MPFILVYITHPNRTTAKRITLHLLKKRLAACANIFPIESSYWWNGKIEHGKEFVSITKTKKENWSKIVTEVKKIHPYKVPDITKIMVSANSDYEKWVRSETK
jgi:periplasmic divalent cation tolerance protein